MFDLPVETVENRRLYTRFRKTLIKDGFTMLQFSVYARFVPSDEAAMAHRRAIRNAIPPAGQVRIFAITDQQFARQEVFYGKKLHNPEAAPQQIMLFQ